MRAASAPYMPELWALAGDAGEERYERKFTSPRPAALTAEHIRQLSLVLRPVYAPRVVNSLYLDDTARSLYWESVDGQALRAKVRVRWYGQDRASAWLELKLKNAYVQRKVRFALPADHVDDWRARLKAADLPPSVRAFVAPLFPAALVSYERRYLQNGAGDIRATIDDALTFARPPAQTRVNALGARPAHRVVELKYAVGDERPERAAHALGLRLTRMSKYSSAMETLGLV